MTGDEGIFIAHHSITDIQFRHYHSFLRLCCFVNFGLEDESGE